jgi:hypothetical protein
MACFNVKHNNSFRTKKSMCDRKKRLEAPEKILKPAKFSADEVGQDFEIAQDL